ETLQGNIAYPAGGAFINIAGADENQTLYARFRANNYTIKYMPLTGDVGTSINRKCEYDTETSIENCTFTRAGCVFVGWSTSKQAILNADETSKISSFTTYRANELPKTVKNLVSTDGAVYTLYPVWQKLSYTIEYDLGVASASSVTPSKPYKNSYSYGDVYSFPSLSAKGKRFKGWINDQGASVTGITSTQTGDVTVHAVWGDELSIQISGEGINSINCLRGTIAKDGKVTGLTFEKGDFLEALSISLYEGYEMTGFAIKEKKSGKTIFAKTIANMMDYVSSDKIYVFSSSDIIIEVQTNSKQYKIIYNLDGGSIAGPYPTTYKYGTETELPTIAKKHESKFVCWKDKLGNRIEKISKSQIGDITVTAVWEKVIAKTLPVDSKANISENGRYLIITDADGVSRYVEIPEQYNELKEGTNEVYFTALDGTEYKTTVSFTQSTQISKDVEVSVDSEGKYLLIKYP
ncbi:MAG: InlB B-repeat-containing protein, partial [Eubacterium sp.]|nr:InlB B-repeat-containing protein [Eubacterium sp.]